MNSNNNIYTCKCCDRTLKPNPNSLSLHLYHTHKMSTKDYYDKYLLVSGENICVCGKEKGFHNVMQGYKNHCSHSCATKYGQWEGNDVRKEALKTRMEGNDHSNGRPLGSKNVNTYPMSEAVLQRIEDQQGREAPWNTNPDKINKQKETWEKKTDEEIAEILQRQTNTKIERGISDGVSYKGKWRPNNTAKYTGNPNAITYRSLWERNVMRFFDANDGVLSWSSEEVIIKYRCPTDQKVHRYFPDFLFTTKRGTFLIEVKPHKETIKPEPRKKTKRFITECLTYVKNEAKWQHAIAYCELKGYTFEIWTEHTLKKMGIPTGTKLPNK